MKSELEKREELISYLKSALPNYIEDRQDIMGYVTSYNHKGKPLRTWYVPVAELFIHKFANENSSIVIDEIPAENSKEQVDYFIYLKRPDPLKLKQALQEFEKNGLFEVVEDLPEATWRRHPLGENK